MRFTALAARLLDRYAGPPVCAVLSAMTPAAPRALPAAPRRILVLKFWEGGLIAMSAPWYRALRRRYPGAELHFLTLDVNAQICGMTGAADKVLQLRISSGLPRFFLDLLAMLPALRAAGYDLIVDLEFLSRFSSALSLLAAPACSAGFSYPGVYRGRPHDIAAVLDLKAHMTANYDALFSALGARPSEADRGPLEFSREGAALAGEGPFVVLNFDRKDIMPERAWPRENYLAVAAALLKGGRYRVVAVGQRAAALPAPAGLLNLTGRLDYRGLAGLFSRAALFITHDSGPLHIAAAMGCPTVSIFGPETPAGYAPLGPRHKVLYLGLPCSPCVDTLGGKELRCVRAGNECVTGITPDMVLAAAQEALGVS